MAMDRQAQPSAMVIGILGAAGMLGAAAFAAARRPKHRGRGAALRTPPIPPADGVELKAAPSVTGGGSIEDSAHELISSARVEGTPVYNRDGERLGSVHSVMIHKRTGQVAYALMSFGGFLGGLWGMGQRVHPLPWDMLTYDPHRFGYVVNLDRRTLEAAPTLSLDQGSRPSGDAYEADLFTFHGATRYWQHWTPI